jgi:3-mercaptopropionate dioxygenase
MLRSALSGPFAHFLQAMDQLVDVSMDEASLLDAAQLQLSQLIADDAWLPLEYQAVSAENYQSFGLYIDPAARYSVVSFVWGPGQKTPVHNHTVWGLVGVLRGEELCREYTCGAEGQLENTHVHPLRKGEIDRVSPHIGDVHQVSNGLADRASISIHVYGGDIGKIARHWFDASGAPQVFISGYTNATPWITVAHNGR